MKRIKVDDKRIINCKADLNQLIPIKYHWAWDKYLKSCANHWMPQEINMGDDIKQWTGNSLSPQEKMIVKRSLGFFSTADSLVANNIVFSIYRHITNPECRQYLLRQAFEEALHTHAYQYCIESLAMDEGEIYNMYHEIPSVSNKAEYCFKYTEFLSDPTTVTGGYNDAKFLKNLIAYYIVMEGIFFYCGFAQILSMSRFKKMMGVSEQFQYIIRDESMHLNFGIDMINQIRIENPNIWTDQFIKSIINIIKEGVELEIEYCHDTMKDEILGLTRLDLEQYLWYTANLRMKQIDIDYKFKDVKNPMLWLEEIIEINKEKNFFEGKVNEYQTGGVLKW